MEGESGEHHQPLDDRKLKEYIQSQKEVAATIDDADEPIDDDLPSG